MRLWVGGLQAVGGRGEIVTATTNNSSGGDVDMEDGEGGAASGGTGGCAEVFRGHDAAVTAMSLNIDGSRLVSGDGAGQVFVWDVSTRQVIRRLKQQSGSVTSTRIVQINGATGPYVNVGGGHAAENGYKAGAGGKTQSQLPMLKRTLWRPETEPLSVMMRFADNEQLEVDFDDELVVPRDCEDSRSAVRRELDEWNAPYQELVSGPAAAAIGVDDADGEESKPDEAETTIARLREELVKVYDHYKDLQAKYDKLESDFVSSQL